MLSHVRMDDSRSSSSFGRLTILTQQDISNHYSHGNLVAAIRIGIEALGNRFRYCVCGKLRPFGPATESRNVARQ